MRPKATAWRPCPRSPARSRRSRSSLRKPPSSTAGQQDDDAAGSARTTALPAGEGHPLRSDHQRHHLNSPKRPSTTTTSASSSLGLPGARRPPSGSGGHLKMWDVGQSSSDRIAIGANSRHAAEVDDHPRPGYWMPTDLWSSENRRYGPARRRLLPPPCRRDRNLPRCRRRGRLTLRARPATRPRAITYRARAEVVHVRHAFRSYPEDSRSPKPSGHDVADDDLDDPGVHGRRVHRRPGQARADPSATAAPAPSPALSRWTSGCIFIAV